MRKLKLSKANAKLAKLANTLGIPKAHVYSLDLLSGYSCPFAKLCKSKAVETPNGLRIQDGPHTQFRCYSASQEAFFTKTYDLRRHNFDVLRGVRGVNQLTQLILHSLPSNIKVLRYHAAGDFFKAEYFEAMVRVAIARPDVVFYGYTKAAPYVEGYLVTWGSFPKNFRVVLSLGGTQDDSVDYLNTVYGIPVVRVIYHPDNATLPIDHDDSHAYYAEGDFAIVLHGYQPAGSEAAKARQRMINENTLSQFEYSRQGA